MGRLVALAIVLLWPGDVVGDVTRVSGEPEFAVLDLNLKLRRWSEVKTRVDAPVRRGHVRGIWAIESRSKAHAAAVMRVPKLEGALAKCEETIASVVNEREEWMEIAQQNRVMATKAKAALAIEQDTSGILGQGRRDSWYESPYLFMLAGSVLAVAILRYGVKDQEVKVVQSE